MWTSFPNDEYFSLKGLLPSSKPMSIPSNNFSPSSHSNIFMQNDGFGMSGSAGSGSKLNSSFSHNNDVFLAQNSSHLVSSLNEGIGSMSPDIRWALSSSVQSWTFLTPHTLSFRLNFDSRMGDLNHLGHDQNMMNSSASNNIYDNAMNKFPLSPIMNSYDRDDNFKNIDLWKMEMDNRKVSIAYASNKKSFEQCFTIQSNLGTTQYEICNIGKTEGWL